MSGRCMEYMSGRCMGIASFTCDSFHSIDTWLFSSLKENYKLKNLNAKEEKVLTLLPLTFFNLE